MSKNRSAKPKSADDHPSLADLATPGSVLAIGGLVALVSALFFVSIGGVQWVLGFF